MATSAASVGTMKAAQISKRCGDFALGERDVPKPGPGELRVKVEACGIYHSDGHPMIERFPLSRVAEAYERMHSGKVCFRAVLMMER